MVAPCEDEEEFLPMISTYSLLQTLPKVIREKILTFTCASGFWLGATLG